MNIDMKKVQALANEVEKSVDVKKVASEAFKDGKVDVKKAAEVIKKEVTADEAKRIAGKAKDIIK